MPATAYQEGDLSLYAVSGSDWALLDYVYPLQDGALLGITDTQTLDSGACCPNHPTSLGSCI